ncbi:hypothetical protein WMY93_016371 [Mugilogobius chulae]|uniref:Flap endonuclease GEN homolog 1 n=1 Tax=Mugilogobius chulae TaxID=88201 RepID=A0AAW0NSV8_9GOBI
MGVHELWSILEPVRKSVPVYSLSGKTLAVDLSLWVCEAQHVQAMMGKVTKPHLRNLFFRVSSLTLMGVKLVFVMEGEAPKLKAETMSKRNQGRFGAKAAAAPKCTVNTNRGRFKSVLRECAEMLDYMGVPWVTAAGEAEAMCAYLDSQGLVDGCITNDGDAFLYGARTVYRNFNMNTKDPQVDCYQTLDIQRQLNLSRENLVGLAIFLGCDYIPKGIQGVGKEQALKLIHKLEGQTVLQRFSMWKKENIFIPESSVKKVAHCNVCQHPGSAKAHEKSGCLLCDSKRFCEPQDFDYQCPCDWHHKEQSRLAISFETNIRKKTLANPLFPFTEIINEFLISKDKSVSNFQRRQPNMLLMQKFAYDKMEWPKHYTSEKVLVLMTYTNLINKKNGIDVTMQVKPLRILKPRVRNGVSCFEVVWTAPEHFAFPDDAELENHQDEVRTVEEEALFEWPIQKCSMCQKQLKDTEDIALQRSVLFPLITSEFLHTFPDMKRSDESLVTAASSGHDQLSDLSSISWAQHTDHLDFPVFFDICDMNIDVVTAEIISDWAPGHFGEDHASSSESCVESMCSSPEMCCPSRSQDTDFSFGYIGRRTTNPTQRQSKTKMSTKRRMKASEREKLRMRSLAEALHQLRDYLPPDYNKRGQPLTKIQTLKYTIEYINKLSDILNHA